MALANCDKALANNKAEALAQLAAFNEANLQAKKLKLAQDSEREMAAIKADGDDSDFRPNADCTNDAEMYYMLANSLASLNSYAAFQMLIQYPPLSALETYVGRNELTPDLFRKMLQADIAIYQSRQKPVPPELMALATKYTSAAGSGP